MPPRRRTSAASTGQHTTAELAELFSIGRSTVYRAVQRARRDVARLVEMLADDKASAGRPRRSVATALVALAGAATPTGALAAGGPAALARVRRLLAPAAPLGAAHTALAVAVMVGVLSAPIVAVAARQPRWSACGTARWACQARARTGPSHVPDSSCRHSVEPGPSPRPPAIDFAVTDRDTHRIVTATAAIGLAATAVLAALGLPAANLHGPLHFLGIMDPLCGMTRGLFHAGRGEWSAAWRYNPARLLLVGGAVAAPLRAAVGFGARRWVTVRVGGPWRAAVMVLGRTRKRPAGSGSSRYRPR